MSHDCTSLGFLPCAASTLQLRAKTERDPHRVRAQRVVSAFWIALGLPPRTLFGRTRPVVDGPKPPRTSELPCASRQVNAQSECASRRGRPCLSSQAVGFAVAAEQRDG